ncbi:MAG TPA: lipopolysaccharide biosynthesis protein [Pyrinomonadaceae bacterium]|nr:lipopolysaccharide biosynthesis protein [Pyrinomonadaceae bacterium]
MPRPEDSVRKRYFSKLSANIVSSTVSFATQALIPRGLGPVFYGNFSFLTVFFQQVVDFFDSGTSIAFYSKLSQRPGDRALVRFYWGFAVVVSLALILLTFGIIATRLDRWVWPDQTTRYILFGLGWGLLSWYTQIINKVVDAYGLTVSGEVLRIVQKLLGLGLIVLMFLSHRFTLTDFFIYQYFILAFLCVGWWMIVKRHHGILFPRTRLLTTQIKSLAQEFYDYSGPLITYALLGMLVGILDRWLLQNFAGSVAQGFYGLSYQIGFLCFVFTSAMTPLFIREMSKAFGVRDFKGMRAMFHRYVPLLYSVAAFLGVFFMVQAGKVTLIFGGSRYAQASVPIGLMSLYAIHRTYGQLSSSVFLATGQTRLYRNLGVGIMLFGLALTFFVLAPANFGGLHLGATGLALKMVIAQLIEVNLGLWFNARFLQFSFWKFLSHQLYVVAPLAGISWLAAKTMDLIIPNPLASLLGSGVIYAFGCGALLLLFPSLLFISRTELHGQISSLARKFKS